jgi:ATP-dependent helicase/nuclease subunit A
LDGICGELDRLVEQGLLSAQYRDEIRPEQILSFFQTPLGERIRTSDNVIREFKFSILWGGEEGTTECQEDMVLLQGVVDCAVIENDGIVLVDFKTDRVTDLTLDAVTQGYVPQVHAYAQALEKIYQKNVKQMLLYFFHMGKFVEV